MKTFITSGPETDPDRFGSSFDPVLTGVAQGLARLFPPIRSAHPSRAAEASAAESSAPSTARCNGGGSGEESRG